MRERYLFHVAVPLRKVEHNEVVNVYDSDLPPSFLLLDDDVRDAAALMERSRLMRWCEHRGCTQMHIELGERAFAAPLIEVLQLPDDGWKFDVAFNRVAADAAVASQVNVLEISDALGLRVQQNSTWDSVVVFLESDERTQLLAWLGRDASGQANVQRLTAKSDDEVDG